MDAIQAPIIAVIGDLIRQHPGTISLGQGVVHYGPPQAALDAARAALPQPETHGYQDGAGIPQLVAAIDAKLRRDNGIDRRDGLRVMVTAGGNMAFVHADSRHHPARATRSFFRCRSISTTRWRFRWRTAPPCWCRPTIAIS